MSQRVLVTRPQPGADATAARLKAAGFEPMVLPLTKIVPIAPERLPEPETCEAVAATSANALRHAPAALLAALAGRPLFAVGDATAACAREAGFSDVRSASGTAAGLAQAIRAALPPGARVLHITGVERTAGFAEALEADGLAVRIMETYQAEEVSYSTDFLERFFSGTPVWGAPVFSTRGGVLLAKLAADVPAKNALEFARFFCISEKAATPLRRIAGARVSVSSAPTEEAVLALLAS